MNAYTPRKITADNVAEFFGSFELHLFDTHRNIPKVFGKAIKAAGGSFHECRSPYDSKRFVNLPAAAAPLMLQLLRRYEADAVIARYPTQEAMDLSNGGTYSSAEQVISKWKGHDAERYLFASLNRLTTDDRWPRAEQRAADRAAAAKKAAEEARQRRIAAIESLLASVPDLQRELAELRAAEQCL